MGALNSVEQALSNLQFANTKFSSALLGREVGNGRCLFTNAHQQLGKLSETLRTVTDAIHSITNIQVVFQHSLRAEVGAIMSELAKLDNESERVSRRRTLEKLNEEYEFKLSAAISTRVKLPQSQEAELVEIRRQYELGRFDLVSGKMDFFPEE